MVVNFFIRRGLKRYSKSAMRKMRIAERKERKAKGEPAPAPPKKAEKKEKKPAEKKTKKVLTAEKYLQRLATMKKLIKSGKKIVDRRRRKMCRRVRPIQKLRPSLVPGVVLIILAGRFRGKRVIFLKQLEKSGLLLVTGPYKLNGVPLRRIAPCFVLATSTRVDISGIEIPAVDEKMFKKPRVPKAKRSEADFFAHKSKKDKDKKEKEELKKKHAITPERKELQKKVDQPILERIHKVALMENYLSCIFTLTHGQYPHAMKF